MIFGTESTLLTAKSTDQDKTTTAIDSTTTSSKKSKSSKSKRSSKGSKSKKKKDKQVKPNKPKKRHRHRHHHNKICSSTVTSKMSKVSKASTKGTATTASRSTRSSSKKNRTKKQRKKSTSKSLSLSSDNKQTDKSLSSKKDRKDKKERKKDKNEMKAADQGGHEATTSSRHSKSSSKRRRKKNHDKKNTKKKTLVVSSQRDIKLAATSQFSSTSATPPPEVARYINSLLQDAFQNLCTTLSNNNPAQRNTLERIEIRLVFQERNMTENKDRKIRNKKKRKDSTTNKKKQLPKKIEHDYTDIVVETKSEGTSSLPSSQKQQQAFHPFDENDLQEVIRRSPPTATDSDRTEQEEALLIDGGMPHEYGDDEDDSSDKSFSAMKTHVTKSNSNKKGTRARKVLKMAIKKTRKTVGRTLSSSSKSKGSGDGSTTSNSMDKKTYKKIKNSARKLKWDDGAGGTGEGKDGEEDSLRGHNSNEYLNSPTKGFRPTLGEFGVGADADNEASESSNFGMSTLSGLVASKQKKVDSDDGDGSSSNCGDESSLYTDGNGDNDDESSFHSSSYTTVEEEEYSSSTYESYYEEEVLEDIMEEEQEG